MPGSPVILFSFIYSFILLNGFFITVRWLHLAHHDQKQIWHYWRILEALYEPGALGLGKSGCFLLVCLLAVNRGFYFTALRYILLVWGANWILHANVGRIIFILSLADSAISRTDIIITAGFVSGASAALCFKAPQSNRQGCAHRMNPGLAVSSLAGLPLWDGSTHVQHVLAGRWLVWSPPCWTCKHPPGSSSPLVREWFICIHLDPGGEAAVALP